MQTRNKIPCVWTCSQVNETLPGQEPAYIPSPSALYHGGCVRLSSTHHSLLNGTSVSPIGESVVTILFRCGPLMDKAACRLMGPPWNAPQKQQDSHWPWEI